MPAKKLSRNAYNIAPGEKYLPYTHGQSLAEFTIKAIVIGAFLGMVFGGANTYLGLKAGLTISTSIPVAVLTVVAFKLLGLFGVRHSILELNMSQTVGSASSSVASGVLFTIPALFIWGMPPTWRQMTLLATSGGLLGVLAMIPLRRYLIKQEHGRLPYPEGMACAEVLVAAEGGGRRAAGVFWGIGIGMIFKLITDGLKLFHSKLIVELPYKATLSVSVSPALIGVGYILGLRIATVMVSGGLLSALVIIPALNWWGSGLESPLFPEQEKLIRDMTASEIWNRYVRYIGAGAVATGGILTLIRSIPTMVESFRLGVGQLTNKGGQDEVQERTDRDLPLGLVLTFVACILLTLTIVPGILGNLDVLVVRALAALLIGVFAFFFVTVSSRIVGLVGVTSNPTSGMTIATLIGTSLIFYLAGWTDIQGKVTALMVGTAVCIAASIAGDTSQDLKTGFVLGATPRLQQIGELIGVLTSAGVVCMIIQLLHQSVEAEGGLGGPELPAPQGVLMKLVIDGVLDQNLPWSLIMIGGAIAIVASLSRMPVLAFAVGVYLPLYTMAAVFLGGLLRHLLTRGQAKAEVDRRNEQGILVGSGLVGGEGLMGVVLAAWVVFRSGGKITGLDVDIPPWADTGLAAVAILCILGLITMLARRRVDDDSDESMK
jgi:putative OPT family oligopeptide transporter